jgi:hypothetical protein
MMNPRAIEAGRDAIGADKDEGDTQSASTPGTLSRLAPDLGRRARREGRRATLDALVKATGWLLHTTRAALTRLRTRGFPIERSPDAG